MEVPRNSSNSFDPYATRFGDPDRLKREKGVFPLDNFDRELARMSQRAAETAKRAEKLKEDELDLDSVIERLNEAAVGAHLLGEFAQEATILMQIAKLLKYVD